MLTLTPTGNLNVSPVTLHVFVLWEEAGVPRKKPTLRGDHVDSTQKGLRWLYVNNTWPVSGGENHQRLIQ